MPSLYRRLRARVGRHDDGPTRREMLTLTLMGAAGLLLSDRLARLARPPGRVLIVGGGFAGLAAAHELASIGYDVRVFEARSSVGGRVRSVSKFLPGKVVEAGAELIGSNHPAWAAYKQRFNLRFIDVTANDDAEPIVLDGKALTDSDAEAVYAEMERAYGGLDALAAGVNADEPWTSPNAAALDRDSVASWLQSQPLSAPCAAALDAEFAADNGVATAAQSALGNLAQIKGGGLESYWTETEVFRCAGGNDQLAARLSRTLLDEHLRCGVPVTRISAGGPVVVTLADNTRVEGDDVILAVPPSTWAKIDIQPALPASLAPQMGRNVKYMAAVHSRFWETARRSPNSLSNGPAQLTWDATDGQGGTSAVLTAFSGGPEADVCRGWAPAARNRHYLSALAAAYPGLAAAFARSFFMDWPAEPWTLASYSFPAPGQVTSQGPALRAPHGRLHLAGEHTNYAFIGYMEGALGSGIAVARRLAERDGLLKSESGAAPARVALRGRA